ncbi:MAG TPA: hypothetical protein EYQ29_13160 [Candidatus Lambdaproteobacteria bacterium]|nr:hypothetical protein [Candidatus Lambdaproteobacteria bacterium]
MSSTVSDVGVSASSGSGCFSAKVSRGVATGSSAVGFPGAGGSGSAGGVSGSATVGISSGVPQTLLKSGTSRVSSSGVVQATHISVASAVAIIGSSIRTRLSRSCVVCCSVTICSNNRSEAS